MILESGNCRANSNGGVFGRFLCDEGKGLYSSEEREYNSLKKDFKCVKIKVKKVGSEERIREVHLGLSCTKRKTPSVLEPGLDPAPGLRSVVLNIADDRLHALLRDVQETGQHLVRGVFAKLLAKEAANGAEYSRADLGSRISETAANRYYDYDIRNTTMRRTNSRTGSPTAAALG